MCVYILVLFVYVTNSSHLNAGCPPSYKYRSTCFISTKVQILTAVGLTAGCPLSYWYKSTCFPGAKVKVNTDTCEAAGCPAANRRALH